VTGGIVFALNSTPTVSELWKSDGTFAGTGLLKDINPGPASADVYEITSVAGVAYFGANDGVNGRELWRSDGTAAGTYLLKDIAPGAASSDPRGLVEANGRLFFVANDGVHGGEIWTSDGTPYGTRLFADVVEGSGSSSPNPYYMNATNDLLFFAATEDSTGRELYAVPLVDPSTLIEFGGTASGGDFVVVISGTSIEVHTVAGQSAGAVAANVAAAIDADPEMQAHGFSALRAGRGFYVLGIGPAGVTWSTTDVGLGGPPPQVSAGSPATWVATAMSLALAARLALSAAARRDSRPRSAPR
jgi:ELWxxDGT repeat protein